jgi:hypothetical protein
VTDKRLPNDRQDERQQSPYRSRDWLDKTIGTAASFLGMLVVLAAVLTPISTEWMATMGVVLGAFGYLLGTRWVGATTILISVAVIQAGLLA